MWEVSEILLLQGPPATDPSEDWDIRAINTQLNDTRGRTAVQGQLPVHLPLPGFNCTHKGKPEASEASLRQSQRQGDFRLWPQSSLRSPPLCPAATVVSEPAGVLHISYMQQSGGTMEQIMNKLGAELWNSSLCEHPWLSAGTAGRRGTRGWGYLNSRRPARVPYFALLWQH